MKLTPLFALFLLVLLHTASHAMTTTYVNPGDDLQAALYSANPGDTLVLDYRATFTGHFMLPNKGGSSYITIQSSALSSLPGSSQRVSPEHKVYMPKIVSPEGVSALYTAPGASYYYFVGIEFRTASSGDSVETTLIDLGNGDFSAQADPAQIPHHLTFDRCYIHAYDDAQRIKRGVSLHSKETSILNSYIEGFKLVNQDSQAVAGWNGPGPFHIINNYLEAAGENIMFGGGDANNPNNQPSDIEIRHNLIAKPTRWRGTAWSVKNLLELKNARRVTIEGNIFEYCWKAAQGTAVIFTPRNQGGNNPWASVNNVIFRNNIIRHVNNGIGTLSRDDDGPTSDVLHDITVANNLLYDIDSFKWGTGSNVDGYFMSFNGPGAYNITIQHNTAYALRTDNVQATGTGYRFEDNTQISGLVIKDNIAHAHYLGGQGAGMAVLNGVAANTWSVHSDLLVLEGYGNVDSWLNSYPQPPQTYLVDTWNSVGFMDKANYNYRLAPGSFYSNKATDGGAIGANISDVEAATGYTDTATTVPPFAPSNFRFLYYRCPSDSPCYGVFSWTDNSNNEAAFTIERFGPTDTTWTTVATISPNVRKERAPIIDNFYAPSYFRVRATNAVGSSAPSNEVSYQSCCAIDNSSGAVATQSSTLVNADVNTILNQPGVSGYYTAGQGGSPTTVPVNRTGRYVRVQLTEFNYLSLAEVQVWSGSNNLAQGKPAMQYNTGWGGTADRAVDGNTDGNWVNNSVTHTYNDYQNWWQVDLGSVQAIDTIQIWNRTDCCSERLSNFYVFVSDVPFTGSTADKAIDGNTDGNYWNGSVTHTNLEFQPWWQVDLNGIRQINTIQVWNRTDCCSERLSNFYVFVSDVPFESTDLTTTINQPGVSTYYTAGQGGSLTTLTINRTGHYVRVQLAGTDYLSLAEVQIW